jgi:hypothetical protein
MTALESTCEAWINRPYGNRLEALEKIRALGQMDESTRGACLKRLLQAPESWTIRLLQMARCPSKRNPLGRLRAVALRLAEHAPCD